MTLMKPEHIEGDDMPDPLITAIARVCHEANRAWCLVNGDGSQPPWALAPDWQKLSAINGVEFALTGATPEQSHENWSRVKIADGWVYGEVKDPAAKTHPCLVPYAQLPPDQRAKDAIFTSIVRALRPDPKTPAEIAADLEQTMRDGGPR